MTVRSLTRTMRTHRVQAGYRAKLRSRGDALLYSSFKNDVPSDNWAAKQLGADSAPQLRGFLGLYRLSPEASADKRLEKLGIFYGARLGHLEAALTKQGVPDWLRLRNGEERTVENAMRAIVGRLSPSGHTLEPLSREDLIKDAISLTTETTQLFGLLLHTARNVLLLERSADREDFYLGAVEALKETISAADQIELLLRIHKERKEKDPFPSVILASSLDSFIFDSILFLHADDQVKRQECLEAFIGSRMKDKTLVEPWDFAKFTANAATRLLPLAEQESFIARIGMKYMGADARAHYFFCTAGELLACRKYPRSSIIKEETRGMRLGEMLFRFARAIHPDDIEKQKEFITWLCAKKLDLKNVSDEKFTAISIGEVLGTAALLIHGRGNVEDNIKFLITVANQVNFTDPKAKITLLSQAVDALFFITVVGAYSELPTIYPIADGVTLQQLAVFLNCLVKRLDPEGINQQLKTVAGILSSFYLSDEERSTILRFISSDSSPTNTAV